MLDAHDCTPRAHAQATEALALIEQREASSKAKPPPLRLTSSQAGTSQESSSSALRETPARNPVRRSQSEAHLSAMSWLDLQERNAEQEGSFRKEPLGGAPTQEADASSQPLKRSSSFFRIAARPPTVRVANSSATERARGVRQAYETLGVKRNISDAALSEVYAALVKKMHPDNNPPECRGLYQKKQGSSCGLRVRPGRPPPSAEPGQEPPSCRRAASSASASAAPGAGPSAPGPPPGKPGPPPKPPGAKPAGGDAFARRATWSRCRLDCSRAGRHPAAGRPPAAAGGRHGPQQATLDTANDEGK